MATPGQPTLYKPEYCELAHNDCLLGAPNEVSPNFFDVARAPSERPCAVPPNRESRHRYH